MIKNTCILLYEEVQNSKQPLYYSAQPLLLPIYSLPDFTFLFFCVVGIAVLPTPDNRYHRFLFYFLLLIIAWLPLPFGSKPQWAMAILQVGIFILSALWLVGFLLGKLSFSHNFHKTLPVFGGFLLISVWVGFQAVPLPSSWVQYLSPIAYSAQADTAYSLQSITPAYMTLSLDPFATKVHTLLSLAYALLFFLVISLVNDYQRVKWLAWTFIICGVFQAIFGSISTLSGAEVHLFGPKEFGQGTASGTFVNRNNYSGHLEMTLAVGMGLLIAQLSDKKAHNWVEWLRQTLSTLMSSKVILRTALAVMVIGLVLGRSRMGNSAFFSSLMITGLLYVVCRKKLTRGMVILFVSLIVIDTAIISQWFGLEKVVARLEQTSLQTETRDNINPVAMGMVPKLAITGSGAGSFYTTLPQENDGSWGNKFYDLAHNDFLQFPIEFGLPAYMLLVLMVLSSFWQAIQTLRLRHSQLMIGMGFASFMGMLAIMIHSSVDFNLQIPANAAYFVIMMALGWIARHLPAKTQSGSKYAS
ncbi:O-antigen ligase family protein [Endozoicomonadaceae bacterium StTr2]